MEIRLSIENGKLLTNEVTLDISVNGEAAPPETVSIGNSVFRLTAEYTDEFGRAAHYVLTQPRIEDVWGDEYIGVHNASILAGVSEQAVRDVLRDDVRRVEVFPGAHRTSDHPQRGEWRIPRAEVEAWEPRRVKS